MPACSLRIRTRISPPALEGHLAHELGNAAIGSCHSHRHGEPEFDSLLPRIVRPLREAQGAAGKIDPAVALDIVLYGRTRIPRAVDVASEGGDKPGDVGLATGAAELLDALGLDVLVVLPLRDEGWVDLERAHAKIARAVQ